MKDFADGVRSHVGEVVKRWKGVLEMTHPLELSFLSS